MPSPEELEREAINEALKELEKLKRQFTPSFDLSEDLAHAIIDMDDIGFSEGLGPNGVARTKVWGALVAKAEDVAGRRAFGNAK